MRVLFVHIRYFMTNKKEHAEQELKKIMAKDIGIKNPVFSPGAIAEMQQVFYLYVDARQRRADIRDIILTANSLGLDQDFEIAFRLLEDVYNDTEGNPLDFESFLRILTEKVVCACGGRVVRSVRMDGGGLSICWTRRRRGNSTLRT